MLLPRPKTGTAPALLQGAAAAKRGVISRDTLAAVCMAALRTPAAALALVGRNCRLRLSHVVLPVGGEGSRERISLGGCISRSPRGEPLLRHVDTPRSWREIAMKTRVTPRTA